MFRICTCLGGLARRCRAHHKRHRGVARPAVGPHRPSKAARSSARSAPLHRQASDFLGGMKTSTAKRTRQAARRPHDVAPTTTPKAMRASSKRSPRTRRSPMATRPGRQSWTRENASYAANTAVVAGYVARFCPAPVPTSPNLARVERRQRDRVSAGLRRRSSRPRTSTRPSTATFASITDLVAAQFLRQVSSYYADVRVDDPPGGYTLIAVAVGPCANVPVARTALDAGNSPSLDQEFDHGRRQHRTHRQLPPARSGTATAPTCCSWPARRR